MKVGGIISFAEITFTVIYFTSYARITSAVNYALLIYLLVFIVLLLVFVYSVYLFINVFVKCFINIYITECLKRRDENIIRFVHTSICIITTIFRCSTNADDNIISI